MNRRRVLVLVLLLSTPALAQAGGSDPNGVWLRGDGNARVRIAACGANTCATNLWIRDESGGEAVGDRLVLTLTREDDDTLAGTAYDPQRDLTYSMRMTIAKDRLQTRGCILGDLLCKSISWTRDD